MNIRSRRKKKTNRRNKITRKRRIKSKRGGRFGWLKRLGIGNRDKSGSELLARNIKREAKAQRKEIIKILKKGPEIDDNLPDCRVEEINVCPEFIGTNHFDKNFKIVDETTQRLKTIRTPKGEFINKPCIKCVVSDTNSVKKKSDAPICVDGRGVEILSDIGEYTTKLDPSKKISIAKYGSKVCNVSNESHSKYYNSLLKAKEKQHAELKRKQEEEKSKSIEEAKLKKAQEKLFKLEKIKRQNEQKKLEKKQNFDSKYHKSKCVCTSSNNKDVITYEIPLYQKCKKPTVSECLDHKPTPSVTTEAGVTQDIVPLEQSAGRNRKRRLRSRKKNNRKRRSKISRKRRTTQMSGGNWLTDFFRGNKKDDVMTRPLLEEESGDVDIAGAPQLPPPSPPQEPVKDDVKEKFAILEKDGVFNVVKLNKDEDGFIKKRFFGGSRRKRRIKRKI